MFAPIGLWAMARSFRYMNIKNLYPLATQIDGNPGIKIMHLTSATSVIGHHDGRIFTRVYKFPYVEKEDTLEWKSIGYLYLGMAITTLAVCASE